MLVTNCFHSASEMTYIVSSGALNSTHYPLFPEYEQRTLCGALVVTLAMLLRLVNCRLLLLLLLLEGD